MKPIKQIGLEISYADIQLATVDKSEPSEFSVEQSENFLSSFYYPTLLRELQAAHSEGRSLTREQTMIAELGFGVPSEWIRGGGEEIGESIGDDVKLAETSIEETPGTVNYFPETLDLLPNYNYLAVISVLKVVNEFIESDVLPEDFDLEALLLEREISIPQLCDELQGEYPGNRNINERLDLLLISDVILSDMRRRRDDLLGSVEIFEELVSVEEGEKEMIDQELEEVYTDSYIGYDPESGTVYFHVDSNFNGNEDYSTCHIYVRGHGSVEVADSYTSQIDNPNRDSNYEFIFRRFFNSDMATPWGEGFELKISDPRSDERFYSVEGDGGDHLVTIQYDKHREMGQYTDMTPHYNPTVREALSYRRHEAAFFMVLNVEHDLDRYRSLAQRVRDLYSATK